MVSTDEASLVLAWPFRVGGIQRSKEALKVRFPGRRNGLSKGQKCEKPAAEGWCGGRGDSHACPAKGPAPIPEKEDRKSPPGQCQHLNFPYET